MILILKGLRKLSRRIQVLFLALIVGLSVFGAGLAGAAKAPSNNDGIHRPAIVINGKVAELKAVIPPSGSAMVPFRSFFEALDLNAEFDNKTKTVTAKNETTTVTLTAGKMTGTINGKEIKLIQGPSLSDDDDLMYVNVRFIAEAFGGIVGFDKSTLTVTLDFD
ncbi:copper amine oxidase N-terminal domain-containing protein [Paenibacillus pasadenensis]